MVENDLIAAAREFSADKRPSSLIAYERHFRDLRESATSILEIGVKRGGSILAWRRYFPNAQIVGVDIKTKPKKWPDRVIVETGDQGDTEFLQRLIDQYGPFDIVIDDGSHMMHHQQLAFETFWPHVKPGGLLIIEDIHTAYNERHQVDGVENTMDYVMKLTKGTVRKGSLDIEALVFALGTALIQKSQGLERKAFLRTARQERIAQAEQLASQE
jgi:23S rRNA U2552 (ribose-2'-O)-methylase RlmE/FtsJ